LRRVPIALFVYNRLSHLEQVILNLNSNKECLDTELIIFSDHYKSPEDASKVVEVRNYISEIKGFKSLKIVERSENFGLSKSIISGVDEILENYNSVIVLEDDVVPSPHFLGYMNETLRFYKNEDAVGAIHAYSYPCSKPLPETFFLRGADCWGWATWRTSWNLLEKNGKVLLEKIRKSNLSHQFDLDGAYPFTQMLRDQISGRNDSWAIRWHASMFLANKLCLYPGKSLVKNIGCDGSGTNCKQTNKFDSAEPEIPITIKKIKLNESSIARDSFIEFLRHSN